MDARGPRRERVGLICRLLGLELGKRGAEDLGLVVLEALYFGLHVSYAGLFGGEVGFVWFRRWSGSFGRGKWKPVYSTSKLSSFRLVFVQLTY